MKNKTKRLCVFATLKKGDQTLSSWDFRESGMYSVGSSETAAMWVPAIGKYGYQLRCLLKRNQSYLEFEPGLTASVMRNDQEVATDFLEETGLLYPNSKGLQRLPLREGIRVRFDLGENELYLWAQEAKKKSVFARRSVLKVLLNTFPYGLALGVFVSLLLHSGVGAFIWVLPTPKAPQLKTIERRYLSITKKDENYIRQRLLEQDIDVEPAVVRVRPRPKPQVPPSYTGFIQAVKKSGSGSKAGASSGFSKLFTTSTLTKDLGKALEKSSLGDVLAQQGSGGSLFDVNEDQIDTQVEYQGRDRASNRLSANISGPKIVNMSGSVSSSGGQLNRESMNRYVNSRAGQLQDCYERLLTRKTNMAGKLTLLLTIGSQGAPTNVLVESSAIKDALFESCVIRKVKAWKFEAPKGGDAKVRFPFIFAPSGRG